LRLHPIQVGPFFCVTAFLSSVSCILEFFSTVSIPTQEKSDVAPHLFCFDEAHVLRRANNSQEVESISCRSFDLTGAQYLGKWIFSIGLLQLPGFSAWFFSGAAHGAFVSVAQNPDY
jgi:hypothetical protein